jgi:hypothetical protein
VEWRTDQACIGALATIEREANGFVERPRTLVLTQDPEAKCPITAPVSATDRSRDECAPEATSPVAGKKVDCRDLSRVRFAVGVARRGNLAKASDWTRHDDAVDGRK